jgi:phosphoglycolate phosphatase-like HAD superfamily hydrolase
LAANSQILALFDLDGTLLRAPDPVHIAGFDHALRAVFGAPASVAELPKSGRLDRDLARAALTSAGLGSPSSPATAASGDVTARRLEEVMAVMGRYYRLRVRGTDRVDWVLEGANDVLRRLQATGIATAISTGSARQVGLAKLAAAGLAAHFPAGAFGDEADDRAELLRRAVRHASEVYGRPFLAPNSVVIGDTPADIEAARAIGARVVAVASGRFPADALEEAGPDALFSDLSNVDSVVRAIRG